MKRPAPVVRLAAWSDAESVRPHRDNRTAAVLGSALGITFTVCFLTGLVSHAAQHPDAWLHLPPRPAGFYRVSQGVHVACGVASVPLLFAKLWSIFPRLFQWPLADSPLHALERLMILPLVGGSLFMLVTGTANIELWYPWVFFFPAGHYAVAYIVIGALVIHLAAKAGIARRALTRNSPSNVAHADGPSRRNFLVGVGGASVGLVGVTVGQTVWPLRKIALFAPRRPDIGVQGFPVNKTAAEAGVRTDVRPTEVVLTVSDHRRNHQFTLDELAAMEQHTVVLPIACVEGWSANRTWTGVRIVDVLTAAGVSDGAALVVESAQRGGRYRRSELRAGHVADPSSLLAMQVDGAVLHPDHGFPLRLIAPNRPGVLQTKWVNRLVVR